MDRDRLVEETIAQRDVVDPDVLRALRTVPRERFVPAALISEAWTDAPLPIGFGQTISQPYIVARMAELGDAAKGPGNYALGAAYFVLPPSLDSFEAARARLGLPEEAYLDMGDFVGGLLKYLKRHPVERVTIAGGFAKLVKLSQGAMDLHSARGSVDFEALAKLLPEELRERTLAAMRQVKKEMRHGRESDVTLARLVDMYCGWACMSR
jgi:hypothetical protein